MTLEDLRRKLRAEGRLTLNVKAVPRSSRDEIAGVQPDGSLKVKVTAVPEKGKANAAICELLAECFNVPRRNVEVTRGRSSAQKVVTLTAG